MPTGVFRDPSNKEIDLVDRSASRKSSLKRSMRR